MSGSGVQKDSRDSRIRDEVEYLCIYDLEIDHMGAVNECEGVYLSHEGERVKDDSQISSLNG